MRFAGKVALVTGGGAGIGRAIARRLAGEGAAVLVFDIDAVSAQALAADIAASGGRALGLTGDVTREEDISAALAAARAAYGGLDVLVCNAAATRRTTLDDLTPDDWDWEMRVTLRAVFLCCRGALPLLAKRRGNVVAVGSVNGRIYVGNPAYSAAKAGLRSLVQAMAVEWGPRGVRANLVSPGTVRTDHPSWQERLAREPGLFERLEKWYPVGRIGTPDDVAAAVAFLASDEAGFVSGADLVVDGGLTAGIAPMAAELA